MSTSGGAPLTAAAAVRMVENWSDLLPSRRYNLASDLRAVTRIAGMPASNVLLTPEFRRQSVLKTSAVQRGVSRSRLGNIFTSLRFVLRRAGVIDSETTPLSADWGALLDRLAPHPRCGLILFARFCTARCLAPTMVSLAPLEEFLVYWSSGR